MKINFKFHNVGQGLFYSGEISKFKFIYDIDSKNELLVNAAIDCLLSKVKENMLKENIDMLILSHLHEDHANGLPYLLNNIKVQTVILPYLPPIGRLITTLQATTGSEEYYQFLANPIKFLFEHGVEQVVLITRGESSEGKNVEVNYWPTSPSPEFFLDESKPELNLENLPEGNEEEVLSEKQDKEIENYIREGLLLIKRRKREPRYDELEAIGHHFKLGSLVKKFFAVLIPHHESKESWNQTLCKLVNSYIYAG